MTGASIACCWGASICCGVTAGSSAGNVSSPSIDNAISAAPLSVFCNASNILLTDFDAPQLQPSVFQPIASERAVSALAECIFRAFSVPTGSASPSAAEEEGEACLQ